MHHTVQPRSMLSGGHYPEWTAGRLLLSGLLVCIAIIVGIIWPHLGVTYQLTVIGCVSVAVIGVGFLRIIRKRAIGALDSRRIILLMIIATVPVIKWSGPGNSALPDLFIGIALLYIVFVAASSKRLRIPKRSLFLPYLGILGAGILATALSPLPSRSFLTIAQEFYLCLAWIAIHNLVRNENDSALVTWSARLWTAVAVITAVLVIVGATNALPGISREFVFLQSRGTGLFRDPNMAAHYLALSLFIIPFALNRAQPARLPAIYAIAATLILVGIIFTKSNGVRVALLASILIVILGRFLITSGRKQLLYLVIAVTFVLLSLTFMAFAPDQIAILIEKVSDDSVGSALRLSSFGYTLENRIASWQRAYDAFRLSPWGVGPGVLGKYEPNELLGYNEAHNDFLSVLAERGWLGFLAFSLFIYNLLIIQAQSLIRSVRTLEPRQRTLALARLGMAICAFTMGLSVDTLHFRHLWVAIPLFMTYEDPRERWMKQAVPE